MIPEERRAKKAEYMRRWRAANPERAKDNEWRWRAGNREQLNETARRQMARWRAEHPEESRTYLEKWRAEHPESVRATSKRQNERQKRLRATDPEWRAEQNDRANARYADLKGVPERELHEHFQSENPNALSMDRVRPDFYIPGDGFVEIKRALPYMRYQWRITSVHFPGLYFPYGGTAKAANNVDAQFAMQPRPLLIIVFHGLTGEELARRLLE
ncbi:MAG TPA: hypothetical protein VFB50_17485 [Chloroflexota bacterium]|nr:hypothetical protein [Chloroflexota bacterium]